MSMETSDIALNDVTILREMQARFFDAFGWRRNFGNDPPHFMAGCQEAPENGFAIHWQGRLFTVGPVPHQERLFSLDEFSARWIHPLIASMTGALSPAPVNEDR
jgi:hypothetical protein